MTTSLIVAIDKERGIGINGQLLCHLPADLEWFRMITIGKPVLMGRVTYQSIGHTLPDRHNIVITKQKDFSARDADTANSIVDALNLVDPEAETIFIGGSTIYEQVIDLCDTLYVTEIDATFDSDSHFPDIPENFVLAYSMFREMDEENPYDMKFNIYKKID
ncbi:dihydrofolate reductase [Vibrio sp. PNB22_3_1]